jgi:uncharacterized protein involved in exopolysaccharide biosynthesis
MANELIVPPPPPAIVFAARSSSNDTMELILYVLFKRWKLIFSISLAFVTSAVIAISLKPPMYRAVAKILLKPSRMSPQIPGMDGEKDRSPFPEFQEQVVSSEIELVKSRDVLIAAARAEAPTATDDQLELEIQRLRSNLLAVNIAGTSVIELIYSAPTVAQAQHTLERILDDYLREHTATYAGSAELLRFYETEKSQAAEMLAASEEERRKWQAQNRVVSIDQQISSQIESLAGAQTKLEQARADAEITLQQDPLIARLTGDLMTSEAALAELKQHYTDADRRVYEKSEQIDLIRGQIQSAHSTLRKRLDAHEKVLERQVREATAALASWREKKVISDRLTRAVDRNRDAFQLYAKNLDEARVGARLDEARLSNVKVIEAAHGTMLTDSRKQKGFLVLSTIVGLATAILIAFGLSLLRPCVRARHDVENELGLPVLALIPDMQRRS